MFRLSEHLYPLDEVIASLIQSIISKKPIDECLFWLWEMETSINTIADGITCIYHLFYAAGNINLDKYLVRKLQAYDNDNNMAHLADVVCALRVSKPSLHAYLIWNASQTFTNPTKIYKSPDVNNNDRMMTGLLRAISHKNHTEIGAYLNFASKTISPQRIIVALLRHCGVTDVNNNYISLETHVITGVDIMYVCAVIARIYDHTGEVKKLFVRASQTIVDEMTHHFSNKCVDDGLQLSYRRKYPTHNIMMSMIGSDNYYRTTVDLNTACCYSWEYYCFESRRWRNRFEKYGGKQNHTNKSIEFPNNEHRDAFYNNGNVNLFEQLSDSSKTYSLHSIDVIKDTFQWFETMMFERLTEKVACLEV